MPKISTIAWSGFHTKGPDAHEPISAEVDPITFAVNKPHALVFDVFLVVRLQALWVKSGEGFVSDCPGGCTMVFLRIGCERMGLTSRHSLESACRLYSCWLTFARNV